MTKFGIINFCNNCYLNVIIQLFLSNKETSNIIAHYLDFDKDNVLINPKKLLNLLSQKMNISRQNDSQEAFTQILDLLPDLEKKYKTKIKNSFRCLECNETRTTTDTYSTFYVYGTSIEESVNQLITDETFELECEHCKKRTNTIKSCKIKNLANILVFYNVTKQKLNFTEVISYKDIKYKLTGFIKHFGNHQSGHYIYYDYINKLIIDDTSISDVDNKKNLDLENIYLLFYTC